MRRSALVLIALVAAGCEAAPDVAGPAAGAARFAAVPGYLPSATGHADIDVALGAQPLSQSYSFNAERVGKEQIVHGEWSLRQQLGGQPASLQGRVTCFVAIDSMARIAGVIVRSDNPTYQRGQHVVWKVVDSGEGANDPRDLASPMLPSSDPDAFCGGGDPAMTEINTGNIQVHGIEAQT